MIFLCVHVWCVFLLFSRVFMCGYVWCVFFNDFLVRVHVWCVFLLFSGGKNKKKHIILLGGVKFVTNTSPALVTFFSAPTTQKKKGK